MEDLPHPCFTRRRAPASTPRSTTRSSYYTPPSRRPGARARTRAADRAERRRARAARCPRFIWITPNLCHDMHDCSPAVGDRFLSRLVPPLLAALGPRGLLFLTWDEGTSDDGCCRLASGGHIATDRRRPGRPPRRPAAHAGRPLLDRCRRSRTCSGWPRLRGAACACTPSLAPLLRRHRRRPRSGTTG